ncbi:MAG: ATP-binding cassette domain-containing protein, partial [Vicinamibacterales bacterium]
TGLENLEMVGRLYHLGRRAARERAHALIDRFGLGDAADRPAKTYSGGMRRRLDLAAALVAAPDVLFLDEPTTGLDPSSRAALWEAIRELVRTGSTLLLTTQYMEEADRLADNVVVIDHGRVIAEGTAHQLKNKLGGERVEIILEHHSDIPRAHTVLAAVGVGEVQIDQETRRLTAAVDGGADSLREALHQLHRSQVTVLDVGLRRPTLDDVFLTLTGHAAANGSSEAGDASNSKPKERTR